MRGHKSSLGYLHLHLCPAGVIALSLFQAWPQDVPKVCTQHSPSEGEQLAGKWELNYMYLMGDSFAKGCLAPASLLPVSGLTEYCILRLLEDSCIHLLPSTLICGGREDDFCSVECSMSYHTWNLPCGCAVTRSDASLLPSC